MARRRRLLLTACALPALAACEDSFAPPSEQDVEYLVERFEVVLKSEAWAPFPIAYLEADLAMVNTSARTVDLEYGACALELEGVEAEEGSGRRTWRSQARQGWPVSIPFACPLYQAGARLEPGDTLRPGELKTRIVLASILADSLPSGLYSFTAAVRMGGTTTRVELGEIHLPVSRFPLQERIVHRDGFRYEVTVAQEALAAGGAISVTLAVDLSVDQTLERAFSAACPVRILAYTDPEEPITIPMPQPAWTWPTTCGAGKQAIRLAPGESAVLEGVIDPGDLGLSPGPYSLVAFVEVDGRPLRVLAGAVEVVD